MGRAGHGRQIALGAIERAPRNPDFELDEMATNMAAPALYAK